MTANELAGECTKFTTITYEYLIEWLLFASKTIFNSVDVIVKRQ